MIDSACLSGVRAAAALVFAFALAACGQKAEQQAPPPAEVGVVTVEERAVPIELTYMARTAGEREVEVRARVSGILERRLYTEGAPVKEGDLLFRIDPAPYAAEVSRARAQVGVEEARAAEARQQRQRVEPLIAQGVVSRREYDQAIAAAATAEAALNAAKAALRTAELNLSYTEVRAPISGVTSREARSEGSLVNAGDDSALLTRIAQTDQLYVEFAMPASEAALVRTALQNHNGSALKPANRAVPATSKQPSPLVQTRAVTPATPGSEVPAGVSVTVQTADGRELPQTAELRFIDTAVDQDSGTVQARATLPNDGATLLPGQFLRARIKGVTLPNATAVPVRAVLRSPMGAMVWVVGPDNKVQPRPVQLGDTSGNNVIVASGLKAGERVIVDGVIKVQPGAVVKPVPASSNAPAQPPEQGAAQPPPQGAAASADASPSSAAG